MRTDHRPNWLRKFQTFVNQIYIDHYVRPHLDASGIDLRVINPGHLEISGKGIKLGDHVHVMALADKPVRLAVFENLGEISIGDYGVINPGVRISSANSITIGDSCLLAMNCYLSDADWHDIQHRIYAPGNTAPIVLKDNVWIGDSALITKGVTIGENSIVGAYSVVTKDVPANSIVVGNPARVVKEMPTENLTSRKALFTGDQPYHEFEEQYFGEKLADNSILGWLSSFLKPGKDV